MELDAFSKQTIVSIIISHYTIKSEGRAKEHVQNPCDLRFANKELAISSITNIKCQLAQTTLSSISRECIVYYRSSEKLFIMTGQNI